MPTPNYEGYMRAVEFNDVNNHVLAIMHSLFKTPGWNVYVVVLDPTTLEKIDVYGTTDGYKLCYNVDKSWVNGKLRFVIGMLNTDR